MRISIQACIEGEGTQPSKVITVGVIERKADFAPASGLGLFLRETHELLQQLQTVVLNEQVDQFVGAAARCRACGTRLGIKDTKPLVYRTAFGKARLRSPRFYSYCSACGFCSSDKGTLSPLAQALPQRVHPQWSWLQCRYASVMSYRLAQIFLRDAFPGERQLPSSSVKVNVRSVGQRLEQEAQCATMVAAAVTAPSRRPPLSGPSVALQIDAGYIKAPRQRDGTRWIPVVASKLIWPKTPHTHAHAYATEYDPTQGLRQQAFLQSVGIGPQVPVTVVCDGGDDVNFACKLPSATARVLDWFHIGMRFEHLLMSLPGLRGTDAYSKHQLRERVIKAKWLLWHGQQARCLERLESLRRDTGWVGARNPLGRLIRYLRGCSRYLVNYQQRRAQGLPISSAGAESVVDYVIGQRMKRNGHMRWTIPGANALLQVRCAVLNGQDVRNFKRWYPPDRRIEGFAAASLAS
ncbi:ISKra4 family transposase [Cupriavidus basilensis]